jgi:hypothetical protein
MSTNRNVREFTSFIKNLGLTVEKVEQNRHVKFHIKAPDGRTKTFSFPVSPSCHRGLKNCYADVRRFANRGGN